MSYVIGGEKVHSSSDIQRYIKFFKYTVEIEEIL